MCRKSQWTHDKKRKRRKEYLNEWHEDRLKRKKRKRKKIMEDNEKEGKKERLKETGGQKTY